MSVGLNSGDGVTCCYVARGPKEIAMESIFRFGATIAVLVAAVALCAPGPNASSEHFVVTNDGDGVNGMLNTGTILKLEDVVGKAALKSVHPLETGVTGDNGGVVTLRAGANICAFLGNGNWNGDSISAFKYPGLQLVGNFADPQWSQSADDIVIAGRGGFLFAGFQINVSPYRAYIDVWTIGNGCAMTLQGTYPASSQSPLSVTALAVTPDGNTLLASYSNGDEGSFSVAANGALMEHGPYDQFYGDIALVVDITSDSKYALVGIEGFAPYNYTQVGVFTINPDGSLGRAYNFGGGGELGPGQGTVVVRLSPDERFLFVTDNITKAHRITTLNFTESPLSLTYTGCIIAPRDVGASNELGNLATVMTYGAGGGLYVGEYNGAVGLFSVNSTAGCLEEVRGSPFLYGEPSGGQLAVWPPRPF